MNKEERITTKIREFTDLITWQHAHQLVINIYDTIRMFPENEKFGLTSQMGRCSVSISSNIAEGFSRRSQKEKLRFYNVSLASLTELEAQLYIIKDVRLVKEETALALMVQTTKVKKLLLGLIQSTKLH